ncbi:MAG: copper homeostasis protein CutC [Bryobacterales bacterium]
MSYTLEVIAMSADEAREAERGGADRLEIVRDLDQGGLTPTLETVREIRAAVDLPLRVMVRQTADYKMRSSEDLQRMRDAAAAFGAMQVDGIVLGFEQNGQADLESVGAILEAAPRTPATFHRAFEAVRDPLAEIVRLHTLPQIDHILTSGGDGNWDTKMLRLETWRQAAAPSITILAGGGLDLERMLWLTRETALTEFHVGTAVRENGVVSADLVRKLKDALERR